MFRRLLKDQLIAFLAHDRIGARQFELARDPDGLVLPVPKQFDVPFHRPASLSTCRNIGRLRKSASGPAAGRGLPGERGHGLETSMAQLKPAPTVVALGPIVPQSNPVLLAEEMRAG